MRARIEHRVSTTPDGDEIHIFQVIQIFPGGREHRDSTGRDIFRTRAEAEAYIRQQGWELVE